MPCQVFKNITLCARENFENFLDRFSTLTNFAHTHTPLWPPDLNGGRKVGKFCSKNNFPTNDRVCVCVGCVGCVSSYRCITWGFATISSLFGAWVGPGRNITANYTRRHSSSSTNLRRSRCSSWKFMASRWERFCHIDAIFE